MNEILQEILGTDMIYRVCIKKNKTKQNKKQKNKTKQNKTKQTKTKTKTCNNYVLSGTCYMCR